MPAERPVSASVVMLAPTVRISAKLTPSSERSIRKPCSVVELSAQSSSISEAETVVATGPLGAAGLMAEMRVRPRSGREKLWQLEQS